MYSHFPKHRTMTSIPVSPQSATTSCRASYTAGSINGRQCILCVRCRLHKKTIIVCTVHALRVEIERCREHVPHVCVQRVLDVCIRMHVACVCLRIQQSVPRQPFYMKPRPRIECSRHPIMQNLPNYSDRSNI